MITHLFCTRNFYQALRDEYKPIVVINSLHKKYVAGNALNLSTPSYLILAMLFRLLYILWTTYYIRSDAQRDFYNKWMAAEFPS